MIYREVTRALENLVLTNELHLLYLVTPLDIRDSIEPQWMTYFKQVRIRQKYAKKSAGTLNNEVNDVVLCLYQYLKEETNYRLA